MTTFTRANVRIWSMLGSAGTFGLAAMGLPDINSEILILTADLRNFSGLDRFAAAHPEQLINVGIAEQNAVGMAAGMSSEGNNVIVTAHDCI